MGGVTPEVALAIQTQKQRYARYADTKQWKKFEEEVLLPDGKFLFLDIDGTPLKVGTTVFQWSSTKPFVQFFEGFFSKAHTLHNIAPGDFEQVKPDEVEAIFAMEDQILMDPFQSIAQIRGGGFYYETWKLVDGEWYIKNLRLERSYQKVSFLIHVANFLQTWLGLPLL